MRSICVQLLTKRPLFSERLPDAFYLSYKIGEIIFIVDLLDALHFNFWHVYDIYL